MVRELKEKCPACNEGALYKRGTVCRDCRELLEYARRRAASDRRSGAVVLPLPFAPHGYRYLRGRPFGRDRFARAFDRLVRLVAPENVGRRAGDEALSCRFQRLLFGNGFYSSTQSQDYRLGSRRLARSLLALFLSAERQIEDAYQRGRADGEHFVVALAEGEVSMKQLNEATMRGVAAREGKTDGKA